MGVIKFKKLYFLTFLSILMSMLMGFVQAQPNTPTQNADVLGIFMVICCCLFYVIFLVLYVYSAFWIYKDAKSLKVENHILWTVLSLLFFPLVFIIYYFFVRKEAKSKLDRAVNTSNASSMMNSDSTDNPGTGVSNSN